MYDYIGNGGDRGRETRLTSAPSNPSYDFLLSEVLCQPSMEGLYWVILHFHHEGSDYGYSMEIWVSKSWCCSWRFYFGFQGIVKWGIGGVSVGVISEWWLWGCGAAAWRLVVLVQERWWSTMGSRRSWSQEDDNIKPAWSTRMSIGGGVWMNDFLCCTLGQLWWVLYSSFFPIVYLIHPVSWAVYDIFASVFCPGRMLEPWCSLRWRAAPPRTRKWSDAGAPGRATLRWVHCSSWLAWWAMMSIGRGSWSGDVNLLSIMIHLEVCGHS